MWVNQCSECENICVLRFSSSMGHVTSYPSKLRQLDLSHNQISSWSSLSAGAATLDSDYLCYGENSKASQKPHVNSDNIAFIKYKVRRHLCRHKKHLLLEYLKTLILADNQLKYIQLTTDISTIIESDDINNPFVSVTKLRLLYPNLSMLDISNNCLKVSRNAEIIACVHPTYSKAFSCSFHRRYPNVFTSYAILAY